VTEPHSLGLTPRPEPDPIILAIAGAAVEQMLRPVAVVAPQVAENPWRFSGRWFSKHHIARRDRP
jgi:hypothetical protein